jgi:hypothetical protein
MFVSDTLQILISTDCGSTWQELFYKGGLDLQTTYSGSYPFYPQSSAAWKHESISLAGYAGNALIRFRCINGSGNNLFLDDVSVSYPNSIATDTFNPGIMVYPNPASTGITIETDANCQLSIFNLNGIPLISLSGKEGGTFVDISALPRGVYVVKVVGEKSMQVGKFIKQ